MLTSKLSRVSTQPSRQRRLLVLIACSLSVLIVQVDSTAVNLALPSISRELGAKTSELQWVVDAYLLVLASLLMFSGSLGDRIGRRKVLMLGLVIFGVGSALCSVSVSPLMLIGMRALQAIGGSMLSPVALSIITNTFDDRKERAQAIGIWGAVIGIGMAMGPIVGGALVDAIDWRSVFWINLPIVVAAVILVRVFIDESKAAQKRGIDVPGQILAIVLLASLTFAIIEGGERGFTATPVLIAAVIAVVTCVVFIRTEQRVSEPLLELGFFRSRPFTFATVIAALVFFAFAGFLFVATLYLQDARGLRPLQAGLVTLPMALANACLAPVSGWMVGRWGARPPMLAAGCILAVGALMLTRLDSTTSLPWFIVAGVCIGAALGTVNAPITNTAVSGMPTSRAGVAGATASTARQLGQSLGVAVLGASLNAGLNDGQSFTSAAHPGWWLLLIVAVCLAVFAYLSGTQKARETEHRVTSGFSG